jgi:hypothetical protein
MVSKLDPAREHIRRMESRIEQQKAAIEQLKLSGQDVSDATRRLNLLERAMEEVRLQLGQLSPTAMDNKRDKSGAAEFGAAHKK